MKKAILAALCFILVSCMFVNGTFAAPDINEIFRSVAEFFQNIENPFPVQDVKGETVNVTIQSDNNSSQLFPGGTATRTSRVMNEGSESVFYRFAYAVQYCDEASWKKLTIDFDFSSEYYAESAWQEIEVDGETYKMKVFTYKTELPKESQAPSITISVKMDHSVTSQEIARYRSNFLMMQVMAIEAQPFIKAEEAAVDANSQVDVSAVAQKALNAALPLKDLNPF